jgi:hypothetical protein
MVASDVMKRLLATYEAGELIIMCAWCRRVEVEDEWVLAPRAALTAIDAPFTLSHSICPSCQQIPWSATPELVTSRGSAMTHQ